MERLTTLPEKRAFFKIEIISFSIRSIDRKGLSYIIGKDLKLSTNFAFIQQIINQVVDNNYYFGGLPY